MDAANTIATSVTIRNGRFVAVNAAPAAGPGVRVIDLGGRTVVPGLVEPHIHIVSLANRPGYHTILENTTSIREVQEALAARRKDVPAGAWITSMGGWHPNQWAEHRHPTLAELDQAVPDRPVLLYERFTGPCATNSLGKAFFDAVDAAPPVHPDIKTVNVSPDGAIAAAGQTGGGSVGVRAVPPAPDADLRGPQAQHPRCDELLGQRRADHASGPGVVPDAGTATSEPDPVQPRPVPHVRSLARTASRGKDHHPPADEFSAEPERSESARVEGTPAQPVPVLRRRHDEDRRDRRVGRSPRERRRLERGPTAGRRSRLAQRKRRAKSRRADAGGRGV